MKKLLFVLLGIFLLIDIFFAFKIFFPNVLNSLFIDTVSVTTVIPNTTVAFKDEIYFKEKLDQIGFWNEKNVSYYDAAVEKVTVKKVQLELTNKPQLWGVRTDTGNLNDALYSYGQKFDKQTNIMTILVYGNPNLQKDASLNQIYSESALLAIFDLTRPYPRKQEKGNQKEIVEFMKDFDSNPLEYSFINITTQ